ncbi:MAG: DUF2914 domain-containing protein [Candidatus Krumholzibacteria bacterium]|nr:DUF2914 domain-containing protein [Candidatus Krumholzibacteria bacterium]
MWRSTTPAALLILPFVASALFAGPQAGPKTTSPPRDTTAVADTAAAPAKKPVKPAEKPAPAKKPATPPPAKKPAPPAPAKEPAPPAPEKKPAPPPAPAAASDAIKRAVFTTGVVDREPVDQLDSLSTSADSVYFFTEVVGMEGEQVTHRWLRDGETMVEVTIDVGGPRWRVYSKKTFLLEWTGTWTVEVLDGEGRKLVEKRLVYYAER